MRAARQRFGRPPSDLQQSPGRLGRLFDYVGLLPAETVAGRPPSRDASVDRGAKIGRGDNRPPSTSLLSADAAGRSSDLFFMGTVLQPLAELGQQTGCTFILVHHFRKNGQAEDSEPAGLEELSNRA